MNLSPAESVWVSGITLFEACLGLAPLPNGRWRQKLEAAFARLLKEDPENRVLDFDSAAAAEVASLAAGRQKAGHPVDMRDTQIAGIACAALHARYAQLRQRRRPRRHTE